MSAGVAMQLEAYLRDHRVSFDVIEHPRSESAVAEARAAHLPAEQTAKSVVLRTPLATGSRSSPPRIGSTCTRRPMRSK